VNIAYFVDGRMPTEKANGYQSAQMCQAFIEAGCEVNMLIPSRVPIAGPGLDSSTSVKDYYGLRRAITIRKLPSLDLIYPVEICLGFSEGQLISKIASAITSRSSSLALALHLLRQPYDILYIRSIHAMNALLSLLPSRLHARIFFELHSLPAREKVVERFVRNLKRLGGVVCVTQHLKKQLLDHGLLSEAVHVDHDAVDLATFSVSATQREARRRIGFAAQGRLASFVGRFHTFGLEKGIPEILHAAPRLLAEFPDLKFCFVGGPLDRLSEYWSIVDGAGIARDRFIFLDRQPIQEVPYYLCASDVLLMPHPTSEFYAYHVSPLKLFEYMSARRPIVGSRLPAIMEILEDGRNAVLCTPGDAHSLAQGIGRVLRDDALAARLAEQAAIDVAEHTWEKRAGRILHFIRDRLHQGS
jgi:glycosyltransferase involved in cell wall biosynthesis